MSLYADSPYPIKEEIVALHNAELQSIAQTGMWLTGKERTATAQYARFARLEAKLQEGNGTAREPDSKLLSSTLRRVISKVATAPQSIDLGFFKESLASGIREEEYVEAIGIVSRVVNLDIFARGLGIPMRVLHEPSSGVPKLKRPASAIAEGAWVATVPSDTGKDTLGRELYGGGPQPFIYRALSLAPGEAKRVIVGGNAQYLPLDKFMDFNYSHHPALTRSQLEIVAGRVSVLNQCFY